MSFRNQKIVVAGGTSGIGISTARLLSAEGATVTVTGRNKEKIKAAEKEGFTAVALDSIDEHALSVFFRQCGNIDHLVIALSGNKGIGKFIDLDLNLLKEAFEAKFWAHLKTVKAAVPFMNAGGSITLITAISATARAAGTSVLAAINGALEIMVPILAKELPPLRINAVSPGVVDTGWWNFLSPEDKGKLFKQYAGQTPVGRISQADDVARAIMFLAGHPFMTGKVIACDGGML